MFRNDRDALAQKVEDASAEIERLTSENNAMRAEILARRQPSPAIAKLPSVYRADLTSLSAGERAALMHHDLQSFPIWAAALLHVSTCGLFSLVHFGLQHDRLPRWENDDPSAGKAIGFTFIPYYNLYWIFFNTLRISDRINLQFRLRGFRDGVPRGLMLACSICSVIPYVNIIALPLIWTVGVVCMQRAVNQLAELRAQEMTAREALGIVAGTTGAAPPRMRIDAAGGDAPADAVSDELAEAELDEPGRRRTPQQSPFGRT